MHSGKDALEAGKQTLNYAAQSREILGILGTLTNDVDLTCLPQLSNCNLNRCRNQLKRMQITHQYNMGFKTNSGFTGCQGCAHEYRPHAASNIISKGHFGVSPHHQQRTL